MEPLRFYDPSDFTNTAVSLVRNGYRVISWAELDQNNNIIYLISPSIFVPPEVDQPVVDEDVDQDVKIKKSKKQILTESKS